MRGLAALLLWASLGCSAPVQAPQPDAAPTIALRPVSVQGYLLPSESEPRRFTLRDVPGRLVLIQSVAYW